MPGAFDPGFDTLALPAGAAPYPATGPRTVTAVTAVTDPVARQGFARFFGNGSMCRDIR